MLVAGVQASRNFYIFETDPVSKLVLKAFGKCVSLYVLLAKVDHVALDRNLGRDLLIARPEARQGALNNEGDTRRLAICVAIWGCLPAVLGTDRLLGTLETEGNVKFHFLSGGKLDKVDVGRQVGH